MSGTVELIVIREFGAKNAVWVILSYNPVIEIRQLIFMANSLVKFYKGYNEETILSSWSFSN